MPDPLINRRLGKYLIQQEIGRGGMARVYRASDTVLQRTVALKILAPQYGDDPELAQRFDREAITAANLRHPAIITIYDVGEAEGLRYIAMEYVAGRTLADVEAEHGALSLPLTIAILQPVADALQYAHNVGAIHRDVKPQNIMIDADGRVLLTDFGIAILPSKSEAKLTQIGAFMGTPEYLSPEQAQARELDGRSDLYSLGVVAYELLGGRLPFTGTVPQLLMAHVYTAPPPLSTVNPAVPPELDPVFQRVLAKTPEQRLQKPLNFLEALRLVAQRHAMNPASRTILANLAALRGSSAGQATVSLEIAARAPQVSAAAIANVFGQPPARPDAIAGVWGPPPVNNQPPLTRPPDKGPPVASGNAARIAPPNGRVSVAPAVGPVRQSPHRIPARRVSTTAIPWKVVIGGIIGLILVGIMATSARRTASPFEGPARPTPHLSGYFGPTTAAAAEQPTSTPTETPTPQAPTAGQPTPGRPSALPTVKPAPVVVKPSAPKPPPPIPPPTNNPPTPAVQTRVVPTPFPTPALPTLPPSTPLPSEVPTTTLLPPTAVPAPSATPQPPVLPSSTPHPTARPTVARPAPTPPTPTRQPPSATRAASTPSVTARNVTATSHAAHLQETPSIVVADPPTSMPTASPVATTTSTPRT
ncbi:MAG: hypothetical protein NVS4B8_04440 [Herpetosiphon sp.]